MEVMTIEQLHEKFKNKELDITTYYQDLFQEAHFQQDRLNAFVTLLEKEVLDQIKDFKFDPNNLLSGIPMVLKDNYSTKGVLTTASSKMLANYVPVYDSTPTKKLKEAGTLIIGKASMDELAMGGTNKSAFTGPVSNPWDSSRISGGSSGGSAALVGSGLVPFALGSDTGDSIRKPAGFCGVVGFKPSWGRISRFGVIPYASSLDHVGAFTRNIRDMAIVIQALAGRDDHDMTSSFRGVPNYLENLNGDLRGKRIAVLTTVSKEVTNPDIKANFDNVVATFKECGAIVEEVEINRQLAKAILPTYTIISNSEATSNHSCLDGIKYGNYVPGDTTEDIMINSRTDGFGSHIKRRFILGNLALATENQEKMFRKAQKVRRLIVEAVNNILEDYDVILTPNSGQVAPHLNEELNSPLSDEYIILENHLALGNFAGLPSLSLPSGFMNDMPLAVNIMGKLFDEQTVLDIAYGLEQALGYGNQYRRED